MNKFWSGFKKQAAIKLPGKAIAGKWQMDLLKGRGQFAGSAVPPTTPAAVKAVPPKPLSPAAKNAVRGAYPGYIARRFPKEN